MKIKRLFFFLLALGMMSSVYSQTIPINEKRVTVKQAMEILRQKHGYSFIFEVSDLNTAKQVSIASGDIDWIVKQIVQGQNISYEIMGKNVVLKKTDSKSSRSSEKKLIGVVKDEQGETVIGANVVIKGMAQGTVTDVNGKFSITVPNNKSVLVFSYIGYDKLEEAVGNRTELNVVMRESGGQLDEIVVIGYGAVRKKDLTGAIGAVKGDVLATKKTTNLSSSLQGSIAGLMVRRESSAPGSSAGSMHIRGVTTIGDSNPLIIVDGVPGNLDYVNPNDVESISVLKDAASASIYGSRAAAGVILVTTKRAGQSELSMTLTGEFGYEMPTTQPSMVGVTRYLEMTNELRYNDTPAGGFYQTYSADQVKNWLKYNATDPNTYPITDWRDLILKKSAPKQSYSLNISAGNKSVRTKATIAYDQVDGLYGDRSFERIMVRVNNDFTINKMLGATLDINIRNATNITPLYSPFTAMRMTPAIYAAMWDDGRIAEGKSGGNPYGLLQMGGNTDAKSTQIGGKASLDFKPFSGFTLSAIVSPFLSYSKSKAFKKKAFYTLASDPDAFGGWLEDNANPYSTNKLSETRNDTYNITTQVVANYLKKIGKHNITAMAGFESYYAATENLSASRDQYELTQYPYLNIGPEGFMDNGGSGTEYAYNSFFGRLMYSFNNKYLFQANVRRDGSSRFAPEHRWGTFPSFSAGWVVTEENFMKNAGIDNWLSFMKLRASWGQLGNERIGDYPYIALMVFGNAMFYDETGLISDKTAAQKKFAVKDVSWETTSSTDIGIDLTFLNNRLRLTADYYWKKTTDMLLTTKIPGFMGYENPQTNAGVMSTKGFDIEAGWSDKSGDWSYGVSLNLSDFVSRVDDLGSTRNLSSKIQASGYIFNEWYGYISEGIYQTAEDVANSAKINNQVQVGDIKYRDISGPDGIPDGAITPEYDRVALGNSLPRFQYGGNINVGYKGFDLSVTFQGIGHQNVNMAREMIEPLRGNYGNIPSILEGNYWSQFNTAEENAAAIYPRLTYVNREANYVTSDYWLFNGSYFRLKNLSLGYTIPQELTKKISMNKVHVYASASDLFCLSNYPKGWDPEMGVSAYPITTSLVFGMSITF